MSILWRIEMLGGLRLQRANAPGSETPESVTSPLVTRFRSRQAGALLAFLAYFPGSHGREALAEMLWPDHEPHLSRAHLRVVLASLRQTLEAPGEQAVPVFVADRHSVGLNFQSVTTDVAEFETALQEAAKAMSHAAQSVHLERAVGLYRGSLLAGSYDEWILPEAQRLEEGYFAALRRLIAGSESEGDLEHALHLARRGAGVNALREDVGRDLMRIYTATGQPALALRHFQELERSLKQSLGTVPGPQTRELRHQIEGESHRATPLATPRFPEEADPEPPSLTVPQPTHAEGEKKPAQRDFSPIGDFLGNRAHLPPQWTRFFGREREIVEVRRLLQMGTRLITLAGVGGSGKTRLALEVARRIAAENEREANSGALVFVPLAPVSDARLIAGAIADAMRLPRAPISTSIHQVAQALRSHPHPILVLDNFEHLLPAGAALVQELLSHVPPLRLLVTSRRELKVSSEYAFFVAPMPVPPADLAPDDLLRFDSVQLFHDRARAVRPRFRITKHNASAVARLCARLEGLPLAIELCAARAGAFSPSKMLVQLERRLDFLAETSPDSMSQHPTLRAALDWSYALLWPELQHFFKQLSAFRGGFSPHAASSLATEPHAAHLLHQLRSASLLTAHEIAGQTRFFLLEVVRELLVEKLTPEDNTDLHRRHAEFYADLAQGAAPHLSGPEQGRWLDGLELEADNLRAALEWAGHNAPQLIPPMTRALGRFWLVRGYYDEGQRWIARVLRDVESQGSDTAPGLPLLGVGAALAWYGGDFAAAFSLNQQQLKGAREAGDTRSEAEALGAMADATTQMGDLERARPLFEQCLNLSRELKDEALLCEALLHATGEASAVGDFGRAKALGDEGTQLSRSLGDTRQTAFLLNMTGFSSLLEGDLARARPLLEESLTLSESVGDKWHTNRVWWTLGHLARIEGDFVLAHQRFDRALLELRDWGCLWPLPYHLEPRAYMDIAEARYERAACLLGAAESLRETTRHALHPVLRPEYERHLALLHKNLDASQLEAAWQKGRALAPEPAASLALERIS